MNENTSMSEGTMNTRQTSYDRHGHRACHNYTPGLRQGLARLMDGGRWRGSLRRAAAGLALALAAAVLTLGGLGVDSAYAQAQQARKDVELTFVTDIGGDLKPQPKPVPLADQALVGFEYRALVRVREVLNRKPVIEGSVSITRIDNRELTTPIKCEPLTGVDAQSPTGIRTVDDGVAVCSIPRSRIIKAGTLALRASYDPGAALFNPGTTNLSLPVNVATTSTRFVDSGDLGVRKPAANSVALGDKFTVSVLVQVVDAANVREEPVLAGAGRVELTGNGISQASCTYGGNGIYTCTAIAPNTAGNVQLTATFTGSNGGDGIQDYTDSRTDGSPPNGSELELRVVDNPGALTKTTVTFVDHLTGAKINTSQVSAGAILHEVYVKVEAAGGQKVDEGSINIKRTTGTWNREPVCEDNSYGSGVFRCDITDLPMPGQSLVLTATYVDHRTSTARKYATGTTKNQLTLMGTTDIAVNVFFVDSKGRNLEDLPDRNPGVSFPVYVEVSRISPPQRLTRSQLQGGRIVLRNQRPGENNFNDIASSCSIYDFGRDPTSSSTGSTYGFRCTINSGLSEPGEHKLTAQFVKTGFPNHQFDRSLKRVNIAALRNVQLAFVTDNGGKTVIGNTVPDGNKAPVGFDYTAYVRVQETAPGNAAVTEGKVSITHVGGRELTVALGCFGLNSDGVARCEIPARDIPDFKTSSFTLKANYNPETGSGYDAAGPETLTVPFKAVTTIIRFRAGGGAKTVTEGEDFSFNVLVEITDGSREVNIPDNTGKVTITGVTGVSCNAPGTSGGGARGTGIFVCTGKAPSADATLRAAFTYSGTPRNYLDSETDGIGRNGSDLSLRVNLGTRITKIERWDATNKQAVTNPLTKAGIIRWRVTFSRAVTITATDAFSLTGSGAGTAAQAPTNQTVAGRDTVLVSANTVPGQQGDVGLEVSAQNLTKISLASNTRIKLSPTMPTGADNQQYTVDRVRPTYRTSPDSVEAGNTITFTMTFDEPMQASRLPRITLDTTARAGGVKVGTVTHGGSNEFTAEITVPTGFGGSSITVTVDANGALDRAGNPAATGTQTAILTVTPAGTGATKPGQDPQLADPSIAVAVDYDLSTTVPDGSPPTLSNTNKRIAVIATVSGTSTVPMQQTDGTVTFTGLPTGATIVGRQNCNAVALAGTGTGGSFTATCTFTPIAGTLAGTYKVTAEFVPAVSTKFNSADDTVDVVLNAGQPTVSKAPQNNRLVLRADPPQGKNPPQREITFDDKTFGAPQAGAGGQLGKITFDVVDKNTGKPPQGKGPGPNNGWSDIPYNDTPQAAKALLRRGVYLVTMKITQSAPGGQTGQQGRAPAPAPAPQQQFTQDFTLQIVAPAGATVPAPTTGKGKIVVQLDTNGGGDGLQAHAFTATPGLGSLGTGFTLTTTKTRTSDTKDSGDLDPNTYTITAADFAGTDYSLSDIGCIVTGTVGSTTTPTASDRKVEVVLNANDIVTCVFSAAYAPKASVATVQKTRQMVADYLGDRNAMLLANGVNMDSRLSRLRPGGNGRSGQVGGTLSVNLGQSEDASASAFSMNLRTSLPGDVSITDDTITFAVSATRLARSGLFGADIYDDDDVVSGDTGDVGDGAVGPQMRWDVWIEGRLSRFDSGNSKDGTLGVVYLGADYLITPNMLIGLMTQYDWLGKDYDTNGRVKGHGWMVGPYAAARFGEALYLDVQARWGRSSNDITPLGTYTDTFKTTRWYVSGKLSGDFSYGDWTIRPGISVQYLSEKQKAYTDSQGNAIAGQTVSEGDVRVGPRLAYTYGLGDGGALVPWAEFEGVYTFGSKGKFSKGTYASDIHGLSGSVEAGFDWRLPAGAMFSLSGSYDGIGSGSKSYGARARIDIPF